LSKPARALELDHLAGQLVDAPRHLRVAAEHLGLDLVDVVLESGDHRRVTVDDLVHDRVENCFGTAPQQLGIAFDPAPDGGQVGCLGMPDRHHEVRAHEQVHLAELDLLGRVPVASRLQYYEQRVAVALELRPLVRLVGVLDGQLVQVELLGQRGQFAPVRPVQTDPGKAFRRLVQHLVGVGQRFRRRDPRTVAVDRTVDHAMTLGLLA